MSLAPDGFDFIRGLAGFVGGAVIFGISLAWSVSLRVQLAEPGTAWVLFTLVAIGVMVLAPAWYWIGQPIYVWFRNRRGDPS